MNTKYCFLLLCCLTFFNAVIFAQSPEKKFKLVIDAGHGGEDPGCRGKKSQEKTVTLNVALKLGKLISDNFDDVQVIYTRKTDVFVEVYKRAVIANNNHADLFISIHCNAAENKAAHRACHYPGPGDPLPHLPGPGGKRPGQADRGGQRPL